MSRTSRADRYVEEFDPDVRAFAQLRVGDALTVDQVFLGADEPGDTVRVYYRFRLPTGKAVLLCEEYVWFDPDDDKDSTLDRLSCVFPDANPGDLEARLRKAGLYP